MQSWNFNAVMKLQWNSVVAKTKMQNDVVKRKIWFSFFRGESQKQASGNANVILYSVPLNNDHSDQKRFENHILSKVKDLLLFRKFGRQLFCIFERAANLWAYLNHNFIPLSGWRPWEWSTMTRRWKKDLKSTRFSPRNRISSPATLTGATTRVRLH